MGMKVRTGRTELGQTANGSKTKCEKALRRAVKTFHPDANLSVLVLWSSLVSACSPAGPIQELLPEQNRLVILRNTAEQGPVWTTLPPPGDTSKSDLVKLEVCLKLRL